MYGFKIILLILILFVGCSPKGEESSFYLETNARWMAGTKIKWASEHYQEDTRILKPQGSWQPILEIEFLDRSFNKVSDCLFYRVPNDERRGELKIVANRSYVNCIDLIGEEGYTSLDGIINFGYETSKDLRAKSHLVLKVDTERLKYQFLNYENLHQEYKLLDSSVDKSFLTGIQITSEVDYKIHRSELKIGDICLDIDDDCNEKVKDQCDRCPYGNYHVIASKCKNKFRRYCGMDKCGRAGFPACIRGYVASKLDPNAFCINDSPVGFCQKGLRVVCLNNQLICE